MLEEFELLAFAKFVMFFVNGSQSSEVCCVVLFQMELKYNQSKFDEQREMCKYLAPVNLIMATWQLIDARNALGYSYDDLELG